jgi:Cu2+-exporting ATPase
VWQQALLYAATVLIITCPCALGLAVPVVQVLASGVLMRAGILLKSGSALERLAGITHAVFDKTGTLTLGKPQLLAVQPCMNESEATLLQQAGALAAQSKHPLSQAIASACPTAAPAPHVQEVAGCGLEAGGWRLGKRSWAAPAATQAGDSALELWLSYEQKPMARFVFSDQLKRDAKDIITRLKQQHITPVLLSGDRPEVTAKIAAELGIADYAGGLSPLEKTERIRALKQAGGKVMMVGDGLNDAPSLASADISLSPTSAIDITQNAADIVFTGERLSPVLLAWRTARFSQRLVRENFWLAIAYNVIAIPLAVAGMVTPLIAAIAMSSSSLLVIANAMRLNLRKRHS